jgi:hypothetical protein
MSWFVHDNGFADNDHSLSMMQPYFPPDQQKHRAGKMGRKIVLLRRRGC